MFLSKCAVRDNKKITIIKQQEARRLLSSLIVFCLNGIKQVNTKYKMNEIVNKFLLVGDKFMIEMYLKQPGFTYSACGPFTKSKERIENFKEKEIHDIFIKTKQMKFIFNMCYVEVIKHLIFLKIQNIMDIKGVFFNGL